MLNRLTKIIILICGLVIFEVGILSLICLYAKVDFTTKQLKLGEPLVKNQPAFELVSGIVPHHDVAKDIIDKFWKTISSRNKPEIIVILSPDHFGSGKLDNEKNMITLKQDTTEIAGLKVTTLILNKLNQKNFTFNSSAVEFDHGIINLLNYIKKYLPESQILPVLIPVNLDRSDVIDFIQNLVSEKNLMVIASTDFSHYLPKAAADLHDIKSQRVILDFDVDQFEKLDVDCWQCLYGARLFSSLKGLEDYEIIGFGNSADIVRNQEADSTTSYFSVIFGRGNFPAPETAKATSLIFIGDMMFDRGVKAFSDKNNKDYPLAKIKTFLRGVDYVAANLEGPIVKKIKDFGMHAMTFNFGPEILPILQDANINVVTLANNHILNRGQEGFKETKEFLSSAGINYSGDAFKCGTELALIKDDFTFLGINKTFPSSCSDEEIAKSVKTLKQAGPDNFLIISIHWGIEYQTKNSTAQQNLAHILIDNGADLIIGHHPHVVQNIEEYKGKLIFYSLGNFVFDQYFSEETQQGLAIGLELREKKQAYYIFPLNLKLSQPKLMANSEKKEFLNQLASSSSKNLREEIKEGVIEVGK